MAGKVSLFDLSGRVAAVTGGNREIGRARAPGLARAGASVLARKVEQNHWYGGAEGHRQARTGVPLDVTNRAALPTALAEVERYAWWH